MRAEITFQTEDLVTMPDLRGHDKGLDDYEVNEVIK
jgi:hypothetical protein